MNHTPRRPFAASRGLSILVAPFLFLGCSAYQPVQPAGVTAVCEPILDRGLFTDAVLADPAIAASVNQLLCERLITAINNPIIMGFGNGASMMGGRVVKRGYAHTVDHSQPRAFADWFQTYCGDDPQGEWRRQQQAMRERWASQGGASDSADTFARGQAFNREQLATLRPVLDQLPRHQVDPWTQCAYGVGITYTGRGWLGCSGFADGAEDGVVLFDVRNQRLDYVMLPLVQLLTGPRLKRDLLVEGAQCEGNPWLRGKTFRDLRSQPHVLECRRLGKSAVRIELETRKQTCTFESPAIERARGARVPPPRLSRSLPLPPRGRRNRR